MSRWKRQERETATLLGGKRQPCTGGHHVDVDTAPFAVEQKTRKSLPQWLEHGIEQSKIGAAQTGKTGIVVLTVARQGVKARRYVLMTMEDFREWHGEALGIVNEEAA
jgi:hypothetical protein